MDKRAIRTPEGARDIIEYNIQRIYHLPSRYRNLNKALEPVRKDLLDILQYIKDIKPIIWHQKYVWYVYTDKLTYTVRKRTTRATSNRHFNFLCCIGVLHKLPQNGENMIGVNMEFMFETDKSRPMNVFTVYRYTTEELERLEQRATELIDHGITSGNISKDKLVASGLPELAREVFFANREESYTNKEKLLETVFKAITELCEEKGYTTKAEVCRTVKLRREQLDNLLKVFDQAWQRGYSYRPPNKQEKEQYQIQNNKWIIKRR